MSENKKNQDVYTIVGQNIKKYRQLKGLTQEQLANKASFSYGYICNLESKKVKATISLASLLQIASALDTEFSNLIEGIDKIKK